VTIVNPPASHPTARTLIALAAGSVLVTPGLWLAGGRLAALRTVPLTSVWLLVHPEATPAIEQHDGRIDCTSSQREDLQ
jgi:hypothetical protein